MEALRWILLILAVLLLAGVYWFGRQRAGKNRDDSFQPTVSDMPVFSARDRDDDWQHGVGPVRVVPPREKLEIPKLKPELDGHILEPFSPGAEPAQQTHIEQPVEDIQSTQSDEMLAETTATDETQSQPAAIEESELAAEAVDESDDIGINDVIVLYLVAHRGEQLKGEQLLSAAIASNLKFGDMNIFHRLDQQQQILFSLSDMKEPGSFVYETMHEHRTRGVSLFIQLNLCADPMQALDDLLICAHQLASLLDLQICDHNRQLLNESVASSLRARARHVYDLRRSATQ